MCSCDDPAFPSSKAAVYLNYQQPGPRALPGPLEPQGKNEGLCDLPGAPGKPGQN